VNFRGLSSGLLSGSEAFNKSTAVWVRGRLNNTVTYRTNRTQRDSKLHHDIAKSYILNYIVEYRRILVKHAVTSFVKFQSLPALYAWGIISKVATIIK
jgi:hypothetical protein